MRSLSLEKDRKYYGNFQALTPIDMTNFQKNIHTIINNIFYCLKDQKYAIIRFSGFSHIAPGDDIDILCSNKHKISRLIISNLRQLVEQGYEIHITEKNHIHIDIIENEKIYLRFDLIDNFDSFRKITIHSSFAQDLLNRRVCVENKFNGKSYPIFIAKEEDDLVVRYLEFLENYDDRPDKIKHYDFILNALAEDHTKASFLKILGEIVVEPTVVVKHGYLITEYCTIRKCFRLLLSRLKSSIKGLLFFK